MATRRVGVAGSLRSLEMYRSDYCSGLYSRRSSVPTKPNCLPHGRDRRNALPARRTRRISMSRLPHREHQSRSVKGVARVPLELPSSIVFPRSSVGSGTLPPPDERGGYRYVRPTATASHLDSTLPRRCRVLRRRSPHHPICRPSSSRISKPVFGAVRRSRTSIF